MAKEVTAKIKLQCPGGQATPAPPVGPALGQHGVNIGEFVKKFNDATKKEMKKILDDIQSGRFARDWVQECNAGQPSFKAMRRRSAEHSIEEVGAKLRAMMPWIAKNKLVDKTKN